MLKSVLSFEIASKVRLTRSTVYECLPDEFTIASTYAPPKKYKKMKMKINRMNIVSGITSSQFHPVTWVRPKDIIRV